QIADVRQDQVDAGQMILGGKGDADVDRQPLPLVRRAVAVDRQVHANLADAAERREYEFLRRSGHQSVTPNPNTSPAPTAVSPPPSVTSRRPVSSRPSKRPVNSRSGRRTRISPPKPAARL